MTEQENIYRSIRKYNTLFIEDGKNWMKELSSAKNYIATPDLKYWTFGKSAGLNFGYHADGGTAKKWLYSLNFVNILSLPNSKFRNQVISAFLKWTENVECYDIAAKYHRDQKANKRFELLVHASQLPKQQQNDEAVTNASKLLFEEGFRNEIIKEVAFRNKSVLALAKNKHGLQCSACGFDYGDFYGYHGAGFIEMHHLNPIANGTRNTSVDDLRPVCANCHRMLHKGSKLLSIAELKKIISEARFNAKKGLVRRH